MKKTIQKNKIYSFNIEISKSLETNKTYIVDLNGNILDEYVPIKVDIINKKDFI